MIDLLGIARLASQHPDEAQMPSASLVIDEQVFPSPTIMGTVNLSRDSTYRESVAVTAADAIRMARTAWAQGAAVIDIGAESSTARAARVPAHQQAEQLIPIVRELAGMGIRVSVETYEPDVAEAGLAAGARVINLTGTAHEGRILDAAAAHSATVILCFSQGANVREITDMPIDADPLPMLIDHFGPRIEGARRRGVSAVVIDPGLGFFYGNLVNPTTRARLQARVLLNGFRLRPLGVPVCNALPHAFDLFQDEFRTAEGFFAVLAGLGATDLMRTHEVARVAAVLRAMSVLDTQA